MAWYVGACVAWRPVLDWTSSRPCIYSTRKVVTLRESPEEAGLALRNARKAGPGSSQSSKCRAWLFGDSRRGRPGRFFRVVRKFTKRQAWPVFSESSSGNSRRGRPGRFFPSHRLEIHEEAGPGRFSSESSGNNSDLVTFAASAWARSSSVMAWPSRSRTARSIAGYCMPR